MSDKEAGNKAISADLSKTDAAEGEFVIGRSMTFMLGKGSLQATVPPPLVDMAESSKICSMLFDEQQGFEPASPPAKPNTGSDACLSCRRRIRLFGFKCRCGGLFCASHRHSDMHKCTFDYKAAARDAISKSNPVVKAEKIQKI